jgi:hypothetical protein
MSDLLRLDHVRSGYFRLVHVVLCYARLDQVISGQFKLMQVRSCWPG